MQKPLQEIVQQNVSAALAEDVGKGDLTALLLDESTVAAATITARENLTLAGTPWASEVFRQLDARVEIDWLAEDGDVLDAGAFPVRRARF